MRIDPGNTLPLPDNLPAETVAQLCDFLRNLADTIESRHAAQLRGYRRHEYEQQAVAEGRDLQRHPEHIDIDDDPLPF